jgi:hypothetical protein
MAHHLASTYAGVAEKTGEPHFLGPAASEAPDARTRTLNQGRMQSRPPFSRRRSSNRPNPNSMPMAASHERIVQPWNQPIDAPATEMCAFDSHTRGEVRTSDELHADHLLPHVPGRETSVSLLVMNSNSTGMPACVFSMPRLIAGTISSGFVMRSPWPPKARAIAA